MVFRWFISTFNKSSRKVILDSDLGSCEIDDIVEDINKLTFIGLEHGASNSSVIVPNDDSTLVSVAFDFSDDKSLENFCKAFCKASSAGTEDTSKEEE